MVYMERDSERKCSKVSQNNYQVKMTLYFQVSLNVKFWQLLSLNLIKQQQVIANQSINYIKKNIYFKIE